MTAVTVPAPPVLATLRSVPLMHAGQWNAMTGTHDFTVDDLAAAVAAMDCPAVRRPILKFGHDGNHGVGLPALGSVNNLALDDDGRTLVGDYVGMPGWLATTDEHGRSVLSSAYPDRSIEGEWDYVCQVGHCHPFVVHAVALLGEERPAIGTLPSLPDLAALYGVALSNPAPTGTPVTLTIHHVATAGERSTMPNPSPMPVSATVTSEDIRRQYYDDADWEYWITELQVDPAIQLIVTSDRTGQYSRVPVVVDGDTVTFGAPIPVQVVYVDREPADTAAASLPQPTRRVVYASRAESRPGGRPAATELAPEPAPESVFTADPKPAEPVAEVEAPAEPPTTVPAAEPDVPTIQEDDMSLSAIRARLGLADDADEAAVLAALDSKLTTDPSDSGTEPEVPAVQPTPEPVAASKLPDGIVAIDAAMLDELRRNAALGAQVAERQRVTDRDRAIDDAIAAGKTAPARRDHWVTSWEADADGTRDILASLEPGLIPIVAAGTTGTGEEQGELVSVGSVASWATQLGISAEELTRG